MITPTHVRVNEFRCRDLLKDAARVRVVDEAAAASARAAKTPASSRLRPVARRAFAPFAAIASLL